MAGTKRRRIKAKPKHAPSITRLRGFEIASRPGQIRRLDPWRYLVKSQSNSRWYNVSWNKKFWMCTCPFNAKTHSACKHIYAVLERITNYLQESEVLCPSCGRSHLIVRRGYYKSRSGLVQRYQCKRCGAKFGARTGFNDVKYAATIVTTALDLYFKGLSLRSIADHINQIHGYHLSHLTIYRWTRKYVKLIVQYTNQLQPKVSQKWHVDEMRVNVNGGLRNLWNLMDGKTRYLIATQITRTKGTQEAKRLLKRGILQTDGQLTLVSDGLPSYETAVREIKKLAPHVHIKHITDRGLVKRNSNNRLERFNGTVRQRIKTMRGLDNTKSSKTFVKGFSTYYNYIRPHMALQGRTPSQVAKTWRAKGTNRWQSLIRASQAKPPRH